jgi:hypothetical protein
VIWVMAGFDSSSCCCCWNHLLSACRNAQLNGVNPLQPAILIGKVGTFWLEFSGS